MKAKIERISIVIICGLLLAGLAAAAGEDDKFKDLYTSDLTIESKFLRSGFVPDGDLAKPQWKRAKWVRFNHEHSGLQAYPEAETEVASLWTKDHIYFAYRAKYTALNTYQGEDLAQERWLLWERDAVEVFINPRPEHLNQYYELQVAPNNQWLDLEVDLDEGVDAARPAWDSGFQHATRVDEKATVWTCEFRIPLVSMKVAAIRPGEAWRLNFFRMDGKEEGGKARRMLAWSVIPGNGPVHTPARFGMIRFVK